MVCRLVYKSQSSRGESIVLLICLAKLDFTDLAIKTDLFMG